MKKSILAFVLLASIGTASVSMASSAPKHRYQPAAAQQQVDKSSTPKQATEQAVDPSDQGEDAVEAYSDTTSTDTVADENQDYNWQPPKPHSEFSLSNYDDPFDFFGSLFGKTSLFVIMLICSLLFLLIVLAPLIIIYLIVRYLMRRHNDKMKLAEMAMEKGINVPEGERPIDKQSDEYLVKRGLRNAFLGLGLCAMFTIWNAEFLAGLGALIFFYGLGQTVIGSLPAIRQWWKDRNNKNNDHIEVE